MINHQSIPVVAQLSSDIVAGRAVAEEVSGRSLIAQGGFEPRSVYVGFLVAKVTIGHSCAGTSAFCRS